MVVAKHPAARGAAATLLLRRLPRRQSCCSAIAKQRISGTRTLRRGVVDAAGCMIIITIKYSSLVAPLRRSSRFRALAFALFLLCFLLFRVCTYCTGTVKTCCSLALSNLSDTTGSVVQLLLSQTYEFEKSEYINVCLPSASTLFGSASLHPSASVIGYKLQPY